ncbi:MAG: M28 family peptidase [Acidobacteriota bacterium]
MIPRALSRPLGVRTLPLSLSVSLLATLAIVGSSSAADAGERACMTFDIDSLGFEALETLKKSPGIERSFELDDLLFVCGEAAASASSGRTASRVWSDLDEGQLFVVRASHPGSLPESSRVEVLARGGAHLVVRAEDSAARRALSRGLWPDAHAHSDGDGCHKPRIEPLRGSRVLARQSANAPERGTTIFSPSAAEAVEEIDFARWFAEVETLAGWNRHTFSPEIDLARDHLVSRFAALGLTVTTPTFQVSGTDANNVLAVYEGTTRPDDWYIVGAHYDSISQNPAVAAPGAEDNASGCAGVLELARVVVPRQPEATILFMCYSGEEQGLFGSTDHVAGLVAAGDSSKVQNVLTMDMIGYTGDADLDVLLETDPPFASNLEIFEDAAAEFTTLRTVTSLNAFGSDHVPYLRQNLPALLTIENDWDSYPSYHRTTDFASNVSQEMGGQILRMNAAVLAQQAGVSDSTLISRASFESGDLTEWDTAFP